MPFYCKILFLQTRLAKPRMKRIVYALLLGSAALTSCSDDTSMVGYDIMPKQDEVSAIDSVFNITTTTQQQSRVLANTSTCYLGSIIDEETGIQTTSGFLTQFHLPEDFKFPRKDQLVLDEAGNVNADSCDIRIYIDKFYGDSLTTMKLRAQELSTHNVLDEEKKYYTDINPDEYINSLGIDKSISYTVKDLTRPDNETNGISYYRQIVIKLPKEYGTKIMRAYFDNPSYFKNSYTFSHNVCPGFSIKSTGGNGAMIETAMLAMNVYFQYRTKTTAGNDTIVDGAQRFGGTEEVLQTTHTNNSFPNSLTPDKLADLPYTYVKSPACYYTELTLPVDEIVDGKDLNGAHYNDSINLAQIIIRHKTNESGDGVKLSVPQQLLLLRKSEVNTFFEKGKLPDSETSYLSASSSDSKNYYAFSNIAKLVSYIKAERDKEAGVTPQDDLATRRAKYNAWEAQNPNWNKLALLPVNAIYTQQTSTYGSTQYILRDVKPQLGLSSVQLEGGKDNPIKMQVIYSRFSK